MYQTINSELSLDNFVVVVESLVDKRFSCMIWIHHMSLGEIFNWD